MFALCAIQLSFLCDKQSLEQKRKLTASGPCGRVCAFVLFAGWPLRRLY